MSRSDNFGERVKALRESRGLTQEDFAARLGITRPYLASIESGSKQPGDTLRLLVQQLEGIPAVPAPVPLMHAGGAQISEAGEQYAQAEAGRLVLLERAITAEAALKMLLAQLENLLASARSLVIGRDSGDTSRPSGNPN